MLRHLAEAKTVLQREMMPEWRRSGEGAEDGGESGQAEPTAANWLEPRSRGQHMGFCLPFRAPASDSGDR